MKVEILRKALQLIDRKIIGHDVKRCDQIVIKKRVVKEALPLSW